MLRTEDMITRAVKSLRAVLTSQLAPEFQHFRTFKAIQVYQAVNDTSDAPIIRIAVIFRRESSLESLFARNRLNWGLADLVNDFSIELSCSLHLSGKPQLGNGALALFAYCVARRPAPESLAGVANCARTQNDGECFGTTAADVERAGGTVMRAAQSRQSTTRTLINVVLHLFTASSSSDEVGACTKDR